jgi:hypothetical protein
MQEAEILRNSVSEDLQKKPDRQKTKKPPESGFLCSGEQNRTADLRVMNPTL